MGSMIKRNVLLSMSRGLAAAAAVVVLLAGCSTTVTPSVVSVSITPSAPTVVVNGTTKLTATVTVLGSAAKTVTWSSSDTSTAQVASDGTVTGKKPGTAKITATSTVDKTKKATVTVTVSATKPVVTSFSASPASVVEGTPSTLSWNVSGASSYTLSDGTSSITIPQTATGSIDVLPATTTTYTLTATNALGDTTATATVTVTAATTAPTINSFTASATSISPGASTTLSWDVSGGITFGLSDGTTSITVPQTNTGSVDVTPSAASTTYTLTATNSQGSVTQTVTVTYKAPTITGLTATNALGSTVDLSWSATDATSFNVYSVLNTDTTSTQLIQANVTGTTLNVAIPDSTHQSLRVVATGAGGTASADVPLTNVVVSSLDYDPYDLQSFTPETPIPGTLRYVLAHAQPGAIIGFASDITAINLPGVDIATIPGRGTMDAHLIFTRDVTISGPAAGVTLTGTSAAPPGDPNPFTWESRMGFVPAGAHVTLDHLTLQGGTFVYDGGAFRNEGDLTLTNTTLTGNRAWYEGGAVLNTTGATLTLVNSHIDNNRAITLDSELGATFDIRGGYAITVSDGGYGGGIYNQPGGTIVSTNTTFDGNESKFSGGGIYDQGGTVTMTTSPVANNSASYAAYSHSSSAFSYGGGIYTAGTFSFSNADFTGNTSADLGGGFSIAAAGTGTLDTVNFDNNTANYGGAIEHYYCTDPSNLTLTGVTFGTNTGLTADPNINLYDTCATVTTLGVGSRHPSAVPPYTAQDMIKIP